MSNQGKVLNKRHREDFSNSVYVGRPTKWGNPYEIGLNGSRKEVVEKYLHHTLTMLKIDSEWLDPLRGKDLVCWCAPLECHADVILSLLDSMPIKQ